MKSWQPELDVRTLRPSELSANHTRCWHALRQQVIGLDDPCLSPEFFQLVEQVRGDVEIVMLSRAGEPVAFLPLERAGGTGYPAALRTAEIHGVIAAANLEWNPPAVIRCLDLKSFDFVCMPANIAALVPHHLRRHEFPCIDLRDGFEEYCRERRHRGSHQLEQANRKARKLQREQGTVRFEWDAPDEDEHRRMAKWKSRRCRSLGAVDVMNIDWIRNLQLQLLGLRGNGLSGVFNTLKVGNRLIAAHLGMRNGPVLCWWYTAYDPEFARYSPGMILLARVCEAAAEQGIVRIDLGQGNERYKTSLANFRFSVAEGVVSTRRWEPAMRAAWIHARDWAQSSSVVATPFRLLRAFRNRLARR